MNSLAATHEILLKERTSSIRRGLMDRINRDSRLIAVKGSRGVGKTNFLLDFSKEYYAGDDSCLYVNTNNLFIVHDGLFHFVERFHKLGGKVLLLDQVYKYPGWDKELRVCYDAFPDLQIVFTSSSIVRIKSNPYLKGIVDMYNLSGLSFREFLDFHGYTLTERKSPAGGVRKRIVDADGELYDARELYDAYIRFGGMPMLADIGLEISRVTAALDGVYSAAVVNDILEREKRKGQRTITDAVLLRKIIMFLADNIGNNTSATSIGNTLVNEGLLEDGKRKTKPAVQTIQAYIQALTEAYFFYEIKRFDIKGKEYLRTLGKYYIVDIGLRNYLLGFREGDSGHILENIIFFELMRRGYDVAIGKIDNQEVDFIATKTDEKKYIQVTETMNAPETQKQMRKNISRLRRQ